MVFKETLCFHCFFPHHLANARKENVKFSICGSRRHQDLLHLSNEEREENSKKAEKATNTKPNVHAKCTALCKDAPEGRSCGKVLLVDILREEEVHRVYAITDDQSNASTISTKLPDWPNLIGLEWKYILSTYGCDKEIKWRKVTQGSS